MFQTYLISYSRVRVFGVLFGLPLRVFILKVFLTFVPGTFTLLVLKKYKRCLQIA